MIQINIIMDLAKCNNGIVTTAMIVEAGLSRSLLKYLVDKGNLEWSSRGVYTLPEIWEDEFVSLQTRYKKGIFSLDTALFLLDLTDRTPNRYHMTFPTPYNLSSPKMDGVVCHSMKESFYCIGIVEVKSPNGNLVKTYSAEKTLCDILRTVNRIDIQIIAEAFKRYAVRKDKDIPLLSEYARILKVEKKLRIYLEVLL